MWQEGGFYYAHARMRNIVVCSDMGAAWREGKSSLGENLPYSIFIKAERKKV